MHYYSPKWMAWVGMALTILFSLCHPFFGLVVTNLIFIMMNPDSPTYIPDRNFYVGMFVLLACGAGLTTFFARYLFCYAGENLTLTTRKLLFESIVHKHLWWFDDKNRAPGILSNILAEDITELNGLTTELIAIILEAFLELIIGVILALCYSWRIALVSLALCPFLLFGGFLMSKLQYKKNTMATKKEGEDMYEDSNALLGDIILNYRTVISFGNKNVDYLMALFDKMLLGPNK